MPFLMGDFEEGTGQKQLSPPSLPLGSTGPVAHWGLAPVPTALPGETPACMSLTLDSTSGGSFAHRHKTHSPTSPFFFHNEGDILALILFIPLSYSQFRI